MEPENLESIAKAKSFLETFWSFGDGRVHLLTIMARPKENKEVSHGDIPIFREIVTSEEKIQKKLSKLQAIANNYSGEEANEYTFRLYASVNARDVRSSFFSFQKQLIDYESKIASGHESSLSKIERLDKEWASILQSDENKDDKYFLIDIDSPERSDYENVYQKLKSETEIITSIVSPNGYHIIVEPFNHPSFEKPDGIEVEIKTDSLFYLAMF